MIRGASFTIELPHGYARRDQLQQFMEAKFPGIEISLVHDEIPKPQVSEALVEHDSSVEQAAESTGKVQDAKTLMDQAKDALSEFEKATES
ncbi:MAG: hypothetical protein JO070_04605 [Verrucomicrobia bacterium]|nr:hypothetical protein [Verrucomicrobiota bacterium]